MTEKQLPWVGYKKDTDKFDFDRHTLNDCKCGYHRNKANKNLKFNTIAEIKFHTDIKNRQTGVELAKDFLVYGCTALEFMNERFDPFGVNLKG
jgi:hypothetical protein